jgi:hypothetical protein
MGSKERKARHRMNMHKDILHAALSIVREEGHRSLSLRRLANTLAFAQKVSWLSQDASFQYNSVANIKMNPSINIYTSVLKIDVRRLFHV